MPDTRPDTGPPAVRVAPPRVFPQAGRSARPPAEAAGAADAHRQTAFVLGGTVDLVLEGLTLEAALAEASAVARHRNVAVAALLATGSRAWLARLQALHAIEGGAYPAAVSLIAAAADIEAACHALQADGGAAWRAWTEGGGLDDLPDAHATQFALASPPATPAPGEAPAALAAVREAAGALASPAPAATLLLAGGESGAGRLAVTFGDRDFHVGLAELASGWLLALGIATVERLAAGEVLPVLDPAALAAWARAARGELEAPRRCRMERREVGGAPRFVVENWRRASSGAARRIVL